jgi:hypothetical protein
MTNQTEQFTFKRENNNPSFQRLLQIKVDDFMNTAKDQLFDILIHDNQMMMGSGLQSNHNDSSTQVIMKPSAYAHLEY